MILPGSFTFSLILLILGAFAWGGWAYTFKIRPGRWRFELYYIDFAVGVFIAIGLLALTAGTFGDDGFSVMDDFRLAGKRQELLAFLAGMSFNLGNLLITGSMSITGMALAFAVGGGVGVLTGAIWVFALNPQSNPVFLVAGAVVLIGAVVAMIVAHRGYALQQLLLMVQEGKTRSTKKAVSLKGAILAFIGGIFLGSFYPILEIARAGEIGLGPYSAALIAAVGIVISTIIYNLFFMNLPVQGEAIDVSDYLRAKPRTHGLGLSGGLMWGVGTILLMVAGRAEGAAQLSRIIFFGGMQTPVLIATLLGIFRFQEYREADTKGRFLLGTTCVLLAFGLILMTMSQSGVAAVEER